MGTIYAITCVETGEQYIGSTKGRLGRRWAMHKDMLKRGVHRSTLLVECVNKHGIARFECEALLEVPNDTLRRVEELSIRLAKPALNTPLTQERATPLKWQRRKRGVDPYAPPYAPEIRKRRAYLVGDKRLTMREIEAKYPPYVVRRVQEGEEGQRVLRPRYSHQ
jgi:hypothetical protein